MWADRRHRLLREEWTDPNALSQEIYAMLTDDETPVPMGEAITFQMNEATQQAPIQINNYTEGAPIFNIAGNGGSSFNLVITGGNLALEEVFPPGLGGASSAGGGGSGSSAPTSAGGWAGQVVSGSGASYQVAVYFGGASATPRTVAVRQLSIDPAETIPAGTWAHVFRSGSEYVMQVPVFL